VVNDNRDRPLLHDRLLSRDKLQADLRSIRRLNDFFATKDIALRLCDRQGLALFVMLLHFSKPLVAVPDAPVVLAQNRPEAPVCAARESDVVGGAVKVRAPDDHLRFLPPLIALIPYQRSALRTNFNLVPHVREPLDQEPLFAHDSCELTVCRHGLAPY
jgi:hypothetical protein